MAAARKPTDIRCPLCHARKGESCRTQQGALREVGGKATPHMQRVVAFSQALESRKKVAA